MKQLSKEQQKQILQNLLQEQKKQAEEIITHHGSALSPAEKKEAVILIMRAVNTTNNYNVDTAPVIEDIENLLDAGIGISGLQKYTRQLYETADKFKNELRNTAEQGLKRRREVNPSYPDFLQKNSTVYFAVENSLSAYQTIEQQIHQINETLPSANRISYNPETAKLEMDKQSFSVGAFFSRRKVELGKLLQNKQIDFADTELMQIIDDVDYPTLLELRKNRSLNKDKTNHDFIRTLGDKVLFHQLADLVIKQHTPDFEAKITHSLRSLLDSYSRSSQTINFTQQKGSIEKDTVSIDTLIVSNHPHQIAAQSEYKNWRNCTSADDFNHHKVIDGIAEGAIIVYGINSHLPQKKISRILLTPYKNEQGDIIYHVNRNYGEYNLAFRESVEKLAKEISSTQNGIYKINEHILPDHAPEQLFQFAGAEEFCRHQNLAYQKEDGKIKLAELNLANSGFDRLPEFFKEMEVEKLNLSFMPLGNLENCPQCQTLDISHCDQLDKDAGRTIPNSVKSLNARFSNFNGLGLSADSQLEELNISNNDNLDAAFLQNLPPRLKSLKANYTNLTSLKGLKAGQLAELSVNGCEIEDDTAGLDLAALKTLQNQR